MKKLLLILSLIFTIPAWALCSVDSAEKVCSISDTAPASSMPLFQQDNLGINTDDKNTQKSIQPSGLSSSFSKTQNQGGIQMQGSLGCQFGNCKKGANNDFLENQ